MLNQSIVFKKKEMPAYDPVPTGIYQVELFDVDVKKEPNYKDKTLMEDNFTFKFAILDGVDKKGVSLRGRTLVRNFVPVEMYISKAGKNLLYRIVEALLARELTKIEAMTDVTSDFINDLIGKQCTVVVEVKTKEDARGVRSFSNISNFLPAATQLPGIPEEELENLRVKMSPNIQQRDSSFYGEPGNPPVTDPNDFKESDIDISNIPF